MRGVVEAASSRQHEIARAGPTLGWPVPVRQLSVLETQFSVRPVKSQGLGDASRHRPSTPPPPLLPVSISQVLGA